jgi:ubiquinone/menaquinone biosynthesis C-methylase UbiE
MLHLHANDPTPPTSGRLVRWARLYDPCVHLLALGQDRAIRRMTVELAHVMPGHTVVDVGCGTGDLTLAAKAQAGAKGRVSGIDAAPEMIEVARRKAARRGADVDFRVGLIEAIPFPDHSVDVVLSSLMMHHLPGDLKRAGLAEIYRVLKLGGRIFIVDFARELKSMNLQALMREASFTQIEAGTVRIRLIGYVGGRAGNHSLS